MSIKVMNYDAEYFTKQTSLGSPFIFKRIGEIVMISHTAVVSGLPKGKSILFSGGQLGHTFVYAHTTSILTSNNAPYGNAIVSLSNNGELTIVSDTNATPIELKFSIITMIA